ncbi:MAG: DUF4342 domain-containing protein [Clostridia bacterium]|nr:DUF4342 domain-containing protein [Clostridia bacterium]
MEDLAKIDEIRRRMGVSYRKAAEALEASGGDVVKALIALEEEERSETWQERINVRGAELIERIKQLLKEGNVNKLVVKHDGKTVLEIPVTVGAIGAILAPYLAILGALAALAAHAEIVVERRGRPEDDLPDDDLTRM